MPALTLGNLVLYSAQAALLIGALALTLAALRPGPAFRLAACRLVLATILLVPLQVWVRAAPPALSLLKGPAGGAVLGIEGIDARAGGQLPWAAIAGGVLAAGIALRVLWLAAGLTRLRRLAGSLSGGGEPPAAAVDAEVSDLQAELGTRARVAFVDRVNHPVTFGIAPAVVLLPASLLAASADRRRAILCHELWHVRRRDWLWVLGEELALTALWFHPAVWWLVGELQLSREQVVDQLTVAATGARREYMDALFSAADLPSAPPLLSGFLRRRHLARRLVSLAEEVVMSRVRLVAGGALMITVLLGGSAVALAAWPLAPMPRMQAQPQIEEIRGPRLDTAGGVRVLHRLDVEVPGIVAGADFGEILLDVDAAVEADGGVTSARVVTVTLHGDGGSSAPTLPGVVEAAATAAVNAIRGWRFEAPPETPASVLVRVRFDGESHQSVVTAVTAHTGYKVPTVLRAGGAITPPRKLVNVAPEYPQEAQDAKIQGTVILEATIAEDGSVKDVEVLRSIPELDAAAVDAVKQWRFEPTLLNGVAVPIKVTTTVMFTLAP